MFPDEFLPLLGEYSPLIIFLIGLQQRWWYLKPHVDEIISQRERAVSEASRASSLAEESHRLHKQALEGDARRDERDRQLDQKVDELRAHQHEMERSLSRIESRL